MRVVIVLISDRSSLVASDGNNKIKVDLAKQGLYFRTALGLRGWVKILSRFPLQIYN
jgi:hypothetical protein